MLNVLVSLYCQQTYASTQDDCDIKVHDAIAVKQGDAEWAKEAKEAKEAMERVWSEETLGGKTRLKVDYPDQSITLVTFQVVVINTKFDKS